MRLRAPPGDDPVRVPARCTHNPSGRRDCVRRSVTTLCVHLRGARTTRAADALARAARLRPCACTCAVHAQPERSTRLCAPLSDDPVRAPA
eukprot:2080730-Pleurochrysis_carterae.AAC.1